MEFTPGSNAWGPGKVYVHGNRVDETVWSYNTFTGESAYHHYEARGHCTLLTDRSGSILEQYEYDAFGQPYFYTSFGQPLTTGSSFGNRFLFSGREWLNELRLYDFRHRMYQPELGRFLQPDPKQFAAGDYNLYRYCHNDPLNKADPLGDSEIRIDIVRNLSIVQTQTGVPLATIGNFTMTVNGSSRAFGPVSGITMEPPNANFNMNKQAGVAKQYPISAGHYLARYGIAGPTGENFKVSGVPDFSGTLGACRRDPPGHRRMYLGGRLTRDRHLRPKFSESGCCRISSLDRK